MFRNLLLCVALCASAAAHADFIEADWLNEDDGLVTVDSNSGLGWLDLSYTVNVPIDNVVANLDSDYAGWRLATNEEVRQLLKGHFGINSFRKTMLNAATAEQVDDWQYHFGITGNDGRSYGTIVGDDGGIDMSGTRNSRTVYFQYGRGSNTANAHSYDGVFLVTESDGPILQGQSNVSNVSVSIAGMLSFVALLGMRRRRF